MNQRVVPVEWQGGGITLFVLVMLIIFIIVMSASIQYIARQSSETSRRSQVEQAFGLADAGVQYVLWLLSQNAQPYTPEQLRNNPPASTSNHIIKAPNGTDLGFFTVAFLGEAGDPDDLLRIRSVGYDAVLTNLCQAVNAEFRRFEDGVFRVTKWDHEVGYPCEPLVNGSVPIQITFNQSREADLSTPAIFYFTNINFLTPTIKVKSTDIAPRLTLQKEGEAPQIITPVACGSAWCAKLTLAVVPTDRYDLSVIGHNGETSGSYTVSLFEEVACNDEIDNDSDTFFDFPTDPQCSAGSDTNESI